MNSINHAAFNKALRKLQRIEETSKDRAATIEALSETYSISKNKVKQIINDAFDKKINIRNTIKAVLITFLVALVLAATMSKVLSVSYMNDQVILYSKLKAQKNICDKFYYNMFDILKHQTAIKDSSAANFKDIYQYLIKKDFQHDDGKELLNWLSENGAKPDLVLEKQLMNSIEHLRLVYFEEYKLLEDINMHYENLLYTMPSKWYVDTNKTIDITLIH